MPDEPRSILDHIEELRTRIVRILISIVIVAAFSFVFSLRQFTFQDVILPIPYPDPSKNFASQVIAGVQSYALPKYVKLIVTSPSQAFLAQMYTSLFLGIVISSPIIAHEIAAFVGPGLYEKEKRLVRNIMIPTTALFVAGCIFSYLLIVPFSLEFLYGYATALPAQTFITLDELISFVVLFVIAFGISFELPVVMYLLSAVGLVSGKFWRDNWRYAFVAIAVFGAVITPDGSGITMWFVAIPMMLLYAAGYLFVRRRQT